VSSHKYLLSNATTSRDASAGIRTEKQQEKVAKLWPGLGATASLECAGIYGRTIGVPSEASRGALSGGLAVLGVNLV
jgi:hypothetical protein